MRPYPVGTVSYAIGKRIFDVVFCCFLLAILSPLFLLIILMIKLTSRVPAFFAQERVSLNGRRFAMLKFRTMYVHDSRESDTRHTERGRPSDYTDRQDPPADKPRRASAIHQRRERRHECSWSPPRADILRAEVPAGNSTIYDKT